ncbi:MAG: S-layer homology domain-containing protein [Clostridia bacterium]|nr:S-layer homology domain-containing protein [Clostridia bacterium]
MNKKILAIVLCLAMLISSLAVSAYAATIDVEIDLSDLFGPSESDPETGDSENEGTGTGSTTKPSTGNKPSTGTTTRDEEDEDEDEDIFTGEETKKDETKEWTNPFTDVKESDWYYETVKYVSENGIFNGMTEDTFVPGSELTRAMLVTVLYRAEGSPRIESDSKFSDIDLEDWFGAPVIWAAENGIVNGISETEFAPNNAITREQIAAIMYRYAQAKKYDTTQGGMAVREYEDYETISSWAKEAMQWAVNTKLINGKTATTVNPQDKATRAEAATIIMRFIEANK